MYQKSGGAIQNRQEEHSQYSREFLPQYRHTLNPISEYSWRLTRPGLKGPAERTGRGKAGLARNVTDVHILLRQQLARFSDACLTHDLRMRQVLTTNGITCLCTPRHAQKKWRKVDSSATVQLLQEQPKT